MPTPQEVHIDAALTNVAVGYANSAFIADLIAPPVVVKKQSDRYYIFDSAREALRAGNDRRAPGTEANEVNFSLSTDGYFCDDHALTSAIPDEERENADPVLQPALDRTEFLRAKIDLNKEIELATLLTNGAVITQFDEPEAADRWDAATSNPVADIEARKATIMASVQALPNTLVLSYPVYAKLRQHPKVGEFLNNTQQGVATAEVLAQVFDVERVLVARAFKNTAGEGQAPVIDYVWGNHALLAYVPTRPAFKQVALAYTFAWGAPGSAAGHRVELWREERRKADMLRVQRYYDQKLIAPGAAFLWKDVIG
jgi:hypothetical protein